MPRLNQVLVFGATGAQGSPVVRGLLEKGVKVRAVSRDAEKVQQMYGKNVEAADADLSDLSTLRGALEQVDAAFFHMPISLTGQSDSTYLSNVLQAARERDLPRLVFTTSGTATEIMPPIAVVKGIRATVQVILSSGVPAIVLRPTIYSANLLQPHILIEMNERGTLSYPPLNPMRRISWTALEDQAALAIAAMTAESVIGKVFDIASPEPITGNELAGILSKKLGHEVRFTPISPAQFGMGMTQVYGEEAGKGIAELYEATDNLPSDGAVIDLEPVLSVLPVKLTPVSEWIDAQDWHPKRDY